MVSDVTLTSAPITFNISLASCLIYALALLAHPTFGCVLLLNRIIWQLCTVRQYHSNLSDQSALEIRVRIKVRVRVALF